MALEGAGIKGASQRFLLCRDFLRSERLSQYFSAILGQTTLRMEFGRMKRAFLGVLLLVGLAWPRAPLVAEQVSLLQVALFQGASQPMIVAEPQTRGVDGASNGASLFAGRQGGSLFAPYAPRNTARGRQGVSLPGVDAGFGPKARLRALIGRAEAGENGYDAVQYGAMVRPDKRPTAMTLQEIYDWVAATPGQPHAIGYYQFIPATLERLVTRLGVGPQQIFTPALQDRLGDVLLAEAGLHRMRRGEIDRHTFMLNLGKIWAGLPNAEGLSHYEGVAGNRASISWEAFDEEMARIFPG